MTQEDTKVEIPAVATNAMVPTPPVEGGDAVVDQQGTDNKDEVQQQENNKTYLRCLLNVVYKKRAATADINVKKDQSITSKAVRASKRAVKAAEKAAKASGIASKAAEQASRAAEEAAKAADEAKTAAQEATKAAEEAETEENENKTKSKTVTGESDGVVIASCDGGTGASGDGKSGGDGGGN